MRCVSTAPDLSSLIERVSEIVSTAILSGTKRLVSSIPGMVCAFLRQITAADGPLQMGAAPPSERARRERIAGRHVAVLEAVREPALALLGRAVSERIRHRVALRLLLQAV